MFRNSTGRSRLSWAIAVTQGILLALPLASLLQLDFCPQAASAHPGPASHSGPVKPIPQSQTAQAVMTLALGQQIERELQGGEKQTFQLPLRAGQYASVIIEQRGIDLAARLRDADGNVITEFDGEIRIQGTEKLEFVAPATTNYSVEVDGKQKRARAGRIALRIAELRDATEQDRSLQSARDLLTESLNLTRAGKYIEALPPTLRALEIRERILGPDSVAVGLALMRIGLLDSNLDNLTDAEPLFKRALVIYEKQSGADSINFAEALNQLAVIHRLRGELAEAEPMMQRVISIREKALGPDHNLVAAALNNLGLIYRTRGDHAKAELMYERSIEIRERTLGPDAIELAPVLTNLASLYYYMGDYEGTIKLDRRVLEIREKNVAPDHPALAQDMGNLAVAYADNGDYEKALPLYQRALEISEKNYGAEHVRSAFIIGNLAKLYLQQGNYEKAEVFYQRTLRIYEAKPADNELNIAFYLHNYGELLSIMGQLTKSETLLARALQMRERLLGPNDFELARTCDALARLYAFTGNLTRAVAYQTRANTINETNIALNLAIGSEHQKLSYMELMSEDLNQTIALHASLAQEMPAARDLAATAILQRKGRVLDAMTADLAALRNRFDLQDQRLFDQLNDINVRLADLVLNAEQSATAPEHQAQVELLQDQKDKIESEISRRSAGFYQRSETVTLAAVRAAIPADAALIELAVYRPLVPKAVGEKIFGDPHYVAYVVRNQGDVRWKELGASAQIDAQVSALRNALRDPKRTDVQDLARALDRSVMHPLRELLGNATRLLISPDGDLNLIPWETFVDENGRFLVERYAVTYLTSGRDLLRMQVSRVSTTEPVVVANPAFGEALNELPAVRNAGPGAALSITNKRRSATSVRSLSDVYFAPLSGTALEARAIQDLLPEAHLLTGAAASEAALKQVKAPRVLHIATHGFFLDDSASVNAKQVAGRASSARGKAVNPLLRSGLALAGANSHNSAKDVAGDGILTALEASGLNLWGTKLVVLSACDTGLGQVRNGEGVYGLRRAFTLAGAESLVMSLWPVSDSATRKFMTGYYRNLKLGMGRAAALRQVQIEMLHQNPHLHPFYWASFIHSGDWSKLDGK